MLGNFHLPLNTLPFDSDTVRIRRGSIVPPALKTYECFFNWSKLYPLTYTELWYGLLLLQEKFRHEGRDRDSLTRWLGTSASSSGILCIAKKLIQSFFNIEIGKFEEAEKCLLEAEKFLEIWSSPKNEDESHCRSLFCEDYLEGFRYILDGTKVFFQVQINETPATSPSGSGYGVFPVTRRKESIRASKVCLDGLKNFKILPPKAKYIVWTVRDVFFTYSFRSNVERENWMENIVEMEPYIPKWHFYLYRALHSARKLTRRPAPVLLLETEEAGENEEERIVTAAGRGGNNDDPLSISYRAMCLAQIFMEKRGTLLNKGDQYHPPWRFGRMMFDRPHQVLAKIQEDTRKILEIDCHLDGVYLNFSEIHLFLLPPENRNTELAIRCLKKAVRLNASNSRTNHRLGLAYYKLNNHMEATSYFRKAIIYANNIGAVFGLLQLLMRSPVENMEEINSIFQVSMKNPNLTKSWDQQCLRTLHYLKGCFHCMLNPDEKMLNEETITSWIIAHDNESQKWSYYFHNLPHQSARFGWPTERLNLANVSNALKHAAYLERTQFRQLLLDICSEVDDAIIRKDEFAGKKILHAS